MAVRPDSGILDTLFSDLHSPPPVHESWGKVYDNMIVHTRGASPGELLKAYRPNEPKEIYDYRLLTYEPITQDAINRGTDSIYRIIFESNYHITYSQNISEYLKEKYFTPDSYNDTSDSMRFMTLMLKYALRLVIDDPNGAIAWMPVNADNPELPPSESPVNEPIEVKPVIVNSKNIVHSSKKAFAWRARREWAFKDSKGNDQTAPFYYLTTLKNIFLVIPSREAQVDDPPERIINGYLYKDVFYFNLTDTSGKERDMLPRVILGGNTVLDENGYWYYQSFFNGFVAWGNEAIRAFSDNQAVRVRGNFPIAEEKGQKCHDCKGAGIVPSPDNAQHKINCGTCNGSGLINSRGPYSTYLVEPPSGNNISDAWALKPAIEFRNPNVDILRESFTTWEKFIDKAEKSINIKFIEEAQSGIAKEVDRSKLYDMLMKFSSNLFDNIIAKSLAIIEAYRVPNSSLRKESIVNAPNSFDIKSQKDLMEEIKELSSSGAPTPFVANTAKQLAGRVFHGDKITIKIIEFLAEYDPFFSRTYSELISFQSAGQLNKEDIPRHNYAPKIVRQIADEQKDRFLTMSYSDIATIADERLAPLIPIPAQVGNVNFGFEQLIEEANTQIGGGGANAPNGRG